MIQYRTNLKWNGPIVISRINREMKQAVRQGAERVRRAAKDPLLNVSGQKFVTPTGLNRLSAKEKRGLSVTGQNDLIRTKGLGSISGLTAFRARPIRPKNQPRIQPGQFTKQVAFGGSYKGVDRIYWNSTTNRWTTSSAPGTPPHKQQGARGGLQGSIAVEIVNDGLRAKIGPGQGLKYARIQELGGRTRFGTLPPRPYMAPALTMTQSAIVQDFFRAIARATK
jgi:phage gpG-like protein